MIQRSVETLLDDTTLDYRWLESDIDVSNTLAVALSVYYDSFTVEKEFKFQIQFSKQAYGEDAQYVDQHWISFTLKHMADIVYFNTIGKEKMHIQAWNEAGINGVTVKLEKVIA